MFLVARGVLVKIDVDLNLAEFSASYVRVRPRMAVEKCHGDIRIMSTGLSGLVPSAWGAILGYVERKGGKKGN